MLAGCGGFIAALGIAFTAVATSPFALAFTLGGLALASVGMHVEVGQLLGLSVENIGKASHESAIRRQKAKKLALEESKLAIEVQKLDLKAKRLAHDPASLTQASASVATSVATGVAAPVSTFAGAPPRAPHFQHPPGGSVVVINRPSMRLWSPGLAAFLSFFLPGLG
jgi:hypothetical protein